MFCFQVFYDLWKYVLQISYRPWKGEKNGPETVVLKNTGKIDIFIFAGPRDGHFWKKQVLKGPQVDFNVVKVALHFP